MRTTTTLWDLLRPFLVGRAALIAENLALRQQLAVLQRNPRRPRLHRRDRIFWVWLSRLWAGWRSALVIVQPDTVVRWHRKGFKLYWRWKSTRRGDGRPTAQREVRNLNYHASRTHLSIAKDSPDGREVEPPDRGEIVEIPAVGGLHHRYARRAA